jgi:hypothetical protein
VVPINTVFPQLLSQSITTPFKNTSQRQAKTELLSQIMIFLESI